MISGQKKKIINKLKQKFYSPKKNISIDNNVLEIVSDLDEYIQKAIETVNKKISKK